MKMIEYWQDGEWIGVVGPKGADYIKDCAIKAGYRVYDGGYFFNVEYAVVEKAKATSQRRGEFEDDNYH